MGSLLRPTALNKARKGERIGRIEEAATYFPLERMGLSPQCGIANTLPDNPLTETDQWQKLELIVCMAEEAAFTLASNV